MPDAMNTIFGREAFLALLESEGVSHLFGNPGTTELPIMAALPDRPTLTYVMALQEALVVAMADGYSRASGDLSVCNVHVAPGLGNAMGSLYNAKWMGSPVIVTAGQQEQGHGLTEPMLYAPLVPIAQPLVKWAVEVTRLRDLPRIVRRAAKVATTPPTGPVFISLPGDILGSISESYAFSCYGGGEAGSVIGAGGEADEVEPAQVVVQIAGGDAAAGAQEVLQPTVAAVHRLHMQIAPNPFPHRAVECFVAHPERGGARWVARAAVGDQQGVLRDHRIEGSRERRRIDPGQHRADRRPAPVCRHENRHLLAREAALLRLAAVPCAPARAHPSGSPGRRSRPLPRSP